MCKFANIPTLFALRMSIGLLLLRSHFADVYLHTETRYRVAQYSRINESCVIARNFLLSQRTRFFIMFLFLNYIQKNELLCTYRFLMSENINIIRIHNVF